MEEVAPQATEAQEQGPSQQELLIEKALTFANLAKGLLKEDPDLLGKIGQEVVDSYKNDEQSRSEWMDRNKNYMKLATQVMERKSFPWDNAANVKYPLLTTAALQFASRAYPSLIPSFDVVKAKVIGDDPDGQMTSVANKLSTHMSHQIMYEIEDWEENMDKLCFVLPIVGTMFKKVYFSEFKKKICSELLSPKDVVVNYYAKSFQQASRVTEIQYFTTNEIKERENKDIWIKYPDFEFTHGTNVHDTISENKTLSVEPPSPDDDTPRKFLVQYRRLDLDDDGYKEPYIVTVDEETARVVSIVANFYPKNIEYQYENPKKVACITPAEWFVKFDFLPNPDGGFYGIGFGILLGGLNDMVNTITNQLIDAGTLRNLQAGFLGRGLRDNKTRNMKFQPGEWKWVNNPGDDLKKNIFPLPVSEPSQTLFNLLGTLVQSGKELASVAEIFTGKMPGQNTPASTTMASIEQGLKVFTSIYKRIYRSMGKEFELIFELSKKYAPAEPIRITAEINGEKQAYNVSRFDYQKALVKIIPAADPNMVSETQKLLRIQGLYELANFQTINMQEMTRQALIYQGQDNIDKLMELPPPQPPLEIQLQQLKDMQLEKDRQLEQMKIMSESQKRQSEIMLNMAKAKELGSAAELPMLELQLKREEHMLDMQMKIMEIELEERKFQMEMRHKQQEHSMDMKVKAVTAANEIQVNKQLGQQKVKQNEEMGNKKLEIMDKQAAKKAEIKEKHESKPNKGSMG